MAVNLKEAIISSKSTDD